MVVAKISDVGFDFETSADWYHVTIDHGDYNQSFDVGITQDNQLINGYCVPLVEADYKTKIIRRAIELYELRP